MSQYYLLELISEYGTVQRKKLYKICFIRPYCVIKLITEIINKKRNLIITDDVDYLYDFLNIRDKIIKTFRLFYNKGSIARIVVYFVSNKRIRLTILLTSKNFDKYYSYDTLFDNLVNYNFLECSICYNKIGNKEYEYFLASIKPSFLPLKSKKSDIIKENTNFFNKLHVFKNEEFKQFNTFRDLVLECIKLDKDWVNTGIFKDIYDKQINYNIINEYFEILEDIAKGIEL